MKKKTIQKLKTCSQKIKARTMNIFPRDTNNKVNSLFKKKVYFNNQFNPKKIEEQFLKHDNLHDQAYWNTTNFKSASRHDFIYKPDVLYLRNKKFDSKIYPEAVMFKNIQILKYQNLNDLVESIMKKKRKLKLLQLKRNKLMDQIMKFKKKVSLGKLDESITNDID